MTLYKFKPLTDFEFVADIIINSRLYSADFRTLNDPMEGNVRYGEDVDKYLIKSIEAAKGAHRVCSLTRHFKNPLLWAHYADGFKGICIEIDVDETIAHCEDVIYTPNIPYVAKGNYSYNPSYTNIADIMAVSVLSRKFSVWNYEEEVRVLNNSGSEHIDKGITVKSIYLGTNTSEMYKEIIRRITPEGIQIHSTMINGQNYVIKNPFTTPNIPVNVPEEIKDFDD